MNSSSTSCLRHLIATLAACGLMGLSSATAAQTPAAAPGKPADAARASTGAAMPDMSRDDMRRSMMQNMKKIEAMPTSGNIDRDFAQMMKIHHQGAIDMAQMELKNGKDAKMRAMAQRIIAAQQKEIKEFDQWLASSNAKK